MKIKYFSSDEQSFDEKEECLLYEKYLQRIIESGTVAPPSVMVDDKLWYKIIDVADLFLFDRLVLDGNKELIHYFKKFKNSPNFPLYLVSTAEYTLTHMIENLEKERLEYQKKIEQIDTNIEKYKHIESLFEPKETEQQEQDDNLKEPQKRGRKKKTDEI
jgi:hypothetical protein